MNSNTAIEQNRFLFAVFMGLFHKKSPISNIKKGLLQTMRKQPCTENPVVAILLINISMIGIS